MFPIRKNESFFVFIIQDISTRRGGDEITCNEVPRHLERRLRVDILVGGLEARIVNTGNSVPIKIERFSSLYSTPFVRFRRAVAIAWMLVPVEVVTEGKYEGDSELVTDGAHLFGELGLRVRARAACRQKSDDIERGSRFERIAIKIFLPSLRIAAPS
jgi:hypothetical protein